MWRDEGSKRIFFWYPLTQIMHGTQVAALRAATARASALFMYRWSSDPHRQEACTASTFEENFFPAAPPFELAPAAAARCDHLATAFQQIRSRWNMSVTKACRHAHDTGARLEAALQLPSLLQHRAVPLLAPLHWMPVVAVGLLWAARRGGVGLAVQVAFFASPWPTGSTLQGGAPKAVPGQLVGL